MKHKTIQTFGIVALMCTLLHLKLPPLGIILIYLAIISVSLLYKDRVHLSLLCYVCLYIILEFWFRLSLKDTFLMMSVYALIIVQYRDRHVTYVIVPIVLIVFTYLLVFYNILLQEPYSAQDFNYEILDLEHDENNNGHSDNQDILTGAYHQAQLKPQYKSVYYAGGIPPETEGVCTDLVWRSLQEAGYNLKAMMDLDIDQDPEAYPYAEDANIDFRRVRNLIVFFERNTRSLSRDLDDKAQWQGGDIVFFSHDHVGILSDHYNQDGLPRLIHSAHPYQFNFEQDVLVSLNDSKGISGHYRWELNEQGYALLNALT